jgi:HD superfamily phosphohydrolase
LQSDPPLELADEDIGVFLAATLLHDIGHYPFSHTLEELTPFFVSHEQRARRLIEDPSGEIFRVLRDELRVDPVRVANVIDYESADHQVPDRDLLLANILSGTLDPDKIDYLLRDSMFCGVPFGESVNRDRLIAAIRYDAQRHRLAITSKGVSAVESLVFTNYLMYRNVYWHHTVRSATAMFKRSVQDTLMHPDCSLEASNFHRVTEGELLMSLAHEQERLGLEGARRLLDGVTRRRLHKVASFIYPGERKQGLLHYLYDLYQHPEKRRQKEVELCRHFGAQVGREATGDEILIDIPRFDKTPEVDLKVFYREDVPSDKPQPLSFDDPEVSRLRESLVDNFEDQAKIFRIFCVGDADMLERVGADVKRHLA